MRNTLRSLSEGEMLMADKECECGHGEGLHGDGYRFANGRKRHCDGSAGYTTLHDETPCR